MLTLRSDFSERAPLLVVVDDAHWLDRNSLEVLAFVSSRLDAESPPPSDRLTAEIIASSAALPEPARAALLLAAVADGSDLTAAASHGAGPDAQTLAPAEQLGLVKIDRTGLHFNHPLVRSAIYHSAPFAQRAAAHRQLAAALEDEPDRRLA